MDKKERSINTIKTLIEKSNLQQKLKFGQKMAYLSNAGEITRNANMDKTAVEEELNNATFYYFKAALLYQEYSKGSGKASIEKYGAKIDDLECYNDCVDNVYLTGMSIGVDTEAQWKKYINILDSQAKLFWGSLDMFEKLETYVSLAELIAADIDKNYRSKGDK